MFVCVSSGVLGPFGPPGRKQRHSGLHHSSQRSVRHHRRSGHHHHVRLRRHAQRREWRVVCRPQVRAGNGPDWVYVHILSVWDIAKSTSMRRDWSLKSALRLSFIWDWQNDILAGEQGAGHILSYKLQITLRVWKNEEVSHLFLILLLE